MQHILIIIIVALAAAFIIRRYYRSFKASQADPCSCGCTSCSTASSCDQVTEAASPIDPEK